MVIDKQPEIVADLVAAAADLVPMLRANADATERRGWVMDENIDALEAQGFFRLGVPERFGGFGADWATRVAVVKEIARGCGSTGWVTAVYIGAAALVTMFPEEAQEEVFARGPCRVTGAVTSGGDLVETPDGYVLNGRWGFHTGCRAATWSLLVAKFGKPGDSSRKPYFVLVPASELTVLDDWDTSGMMGTGSNTVVAQDVLVKRYRIVPLADAVGDVQITTLGVVLGMATSAIELFLDSLPGRSITFTNYTEKREAPITHILTAEAQLRADTAELLTSNLIQKCERRYQSGETQTQDERSVMEAHKNHVYRLCREAVEFIYSESGASSISRSVPIQRIWRDIEALCLHAMHNMHTNLERYGRYLVGLETAP